MSELFRKIAPVVDELGDIFAARGYELALVGGSVRDVFLGRIGNDLDLTTDARPEAVLELIRDWADSIWTIGIDFGTVGARKGSWLLEITTYRSESYDPKSRKPEVVYGDTLEGDLARRDFAVNAMALRLPGREFVDPHGGLDDLHAKVMRTPGPPERSFDDDPLRMLRAARFASQLGFTVDPAAFAAMTAMAERIEIVSAERIRDELDKLICGDHPRDGLRNLVDSGLAAHVLPELPKLRLEIDEHHRHKDVYEHTLIVLEQAIDLEEGGPDRNLRWAALMHDVGKPKTRRHEAAGRVSFHHHEVVGAQLTKKRMGELRAPLPQGRGGRRVAPGRAAPALPRLRQRRVDRLGGAPLRPRRRAPARPAAQADPRRLHHPQPAQGPGSVADLRPA
jgi:poly(A) polymerase